MATEMSEHQDIMQAARMLGSRRSESPWIVSTIRRSEPDGREVYGVINGVRFVGRREHGEAPWWVSVERRAQPWERHPLTGWSG
jgi:hypothetical protein